MWGGTTESLEAYKQYFQPYVCAEDAHIAETFKDPADMWIGESQQPSVIMYNKTLVPENEVPKTWADLLDSKWQGKIASANPASSGSAYTLLYNHASSTLNLPGEDSSSHAFPAGVTTASQAIDFDVWGNPAGGTATVSLSGEGTAKTITINANPMARGVSALPLFTAPMIANTKMKVPTNSASALRRRPLMKFSLLRRRREDRHP